MIDRYINIYVKVEEDAIFNREVINGICKEQYPKIQLDYDLDIPIIKAYVNGSLIVLITL
jgi:hypothetical protein